MGGLVTIVTPAVSTALTTLAHVQEELGIGATEEAAYLSRLIDRASSLIIGEIGRTLGVQTATEAYMPDSRRWSYRSVCLSYFPVITATVTEDGTALVAGTDYEIDKDAGLIYRLSTTPARVSWSNSVQIAVTYQAGYQLPNDAASAGVPMLPDAIEAVCIALVKAAYAARGRDPSIVSDQLEGVGAVRYATGATLGMTITEDLCEALEPYTRIVL